MEPTTLFVSPQPQAAPQPVQLRILQQEQPTLTPYSDKSVVLRSSKQWGLDHKDQLQALGGKFNGRLQGGAGWIFPTSRQEEVKVYLQTGQVQPRTTQPSRFKSRQYAPQTAAPIAPLTTVPPPQALTQAVAVPTQTITYTVPKPAVDMKVSVRANGGEGEYKVTAAPPKADGRVDEIQLTGGGQTVTAVLVNGHWQIYGWFIPHELVFS
jgi:hypothetical protein